MDTCTTAPILLATLAVSGASGLMAQAVETPPDSHLVEWLGAADVAADSVAVVDTRLEGNVEALILRVPAHQGGYEYWTVSRAASEPRQIVRMGVLAAHWGKPSVEAVVDGTVYVRKLDGYGAPLLHRYELADDGSIIEEDFTPPRPGPVAALGDSAFAAWSLGNGGQLALAASLIDEGAVPYHFRVEEPIETIGRWGDTVAFVTASKAMVRRPGGGWGGYRVPLPGTQPEGARLLHPSLPQFRVVPGGVAELRLRDTLFIPLDFPDFAHFRAARPDHLPGVEPEEVDIEVDIGPATDDGERVWFGLTFYDGEGYDGVGGIGWLDPATRDAELVYPPEMSDYSVSAVTVDRGTLLLGLAIRGEGAIHDAGLARYDPATRAFEPVLRSGYISAITVRDDRIFVTSDLGLIEVRPDGNVRRWQVFPPLRLGGSPIVVFRRDVPRH